ncbi:hypothetical protein PVNG_02717 [Plasmodium vivax North Korean]|uniref:Uncharacterized protein n=1 Tax=Plasmodium vivax North Korean TaxID=1035514 RepID=A0A0J9W7N5_PLAVI|nr:hypothetical protein PVNG_02717 [Plasmodium vivax North Korean]
MFIFFFFSFSFCKLNEKNADERSEFINNFNAEKCAQRRVQSGPEILEKRGVEEEPERKHTKKCCNNYELIKLEIEFVATLNVLTCEELEALFCFFFPEKIFSFSECTDKEIIIEHFLQNISSVSEKYSSLIKSGMCLAYDEPILNKDAKCATLQEYLNGLKASGEAQNSCADEPKVEGEVVSHEIDGKEREGVEGDTGGYGAKMGSDAAGEITAIEEIPQNGGNEEHGAMGEGGVDPMRKAASEANQLTSSVANERTGEDAAKVVKRRRTKKPKGLDAGTGQLNPKNQILINISDCDILKHNDKIFINLSALREVKADAERKGENDAILIVSGSGEAGTSGVEPGKVCTNEVETNEVDTHEVDKNEVDPVTTNPPTADPTADANANETAPSAKKASPERVSNPQANAASTGGGHENDVNPPLSVNKEAKRCRKKKDTNEKCTTQVGKKAQTGGKNCTEGNSQPKKKIKVDDLPGDNSAQTEEGSPKGILLKESSNISGRPDEDKAKNGNTNTSRGNSPQSSSSDSSTPSKVMDEEKEFRSSDELVHARNIEQDEDTNDMKGDAADVHHSGLGETHEKNTTPVDQGGRVRKVVPLKGAAKMTAAKKINREENVKGKKRKKTNNDDEGNKANYSKKIKCPIGKKPNCPTRHNEIHQNKKTPPNGRGKASKLNMRGGDKAQCNASQRNSKNLKGGKCVGSTGGNGALSCVHKNSIKGKVPTRKKPHVDHSRHDGNNHLGGSKSNASLKRQFNSISAEGENRRNSAKMGTKQLCNVSKDNIIQADAMNWSRTRSCRLGR